MQVFKPTFRKTLRLIWLVQGAVIALMVLLVAGGLWMTGQTRMVPYAVMGLVLSAVLISLLGAPALQKLLTIELDEEKICVLGWMKAMFTMRWADVDEVRAGNILGIQAVSLKNTASGKQIGFYVLTDDHQGLAAALRQYAPPGHPLQRYVEKYLA